MTRFELQTSGVGCDALPTAPRPITQILLQLTVISCSTRDADDLIICTLRYYTYRQSNTYLQPFESGISFIPAYHPVTPSRN